MSDLELRAIGKAMARGVIFSESGMALQYRRFMPEAEIGKKYPLVLFLHGKSVRGRDNEAHVVRPGSAIRYALSAHQKENPCHILAPQCPEAATWWDPGMPELIKQLLGEVLMDDSVDRLRVYVTGASMGGIAAWHLAARHPDLFAAAMPICGAASLEDAGKIGQLPLWAFHAADDDVVPAGGFMPNPPKAPVYGSRLAAIQARAAGSRHIQYTEYPPGLIGEKWGDVHAAWHEAYRDDDARRWLFAQTKENRYEQRSIAPGIWALTDWMGDSFYVVDGKDRALVIDTGMAAGDIRPVIERLTPRPYALALTHGHGDHSFHAPLFDKVHLCMADKHMLYAGRFPGQQSPDEGALSPLNDGDFIDLGGGINIKVIALPGHTPGSLLFVDEARKCVFTGDALGSGALAWMQVPGASPLSDYAKSIAAAKQRLLTMGAKPASWAFLPGHAGQQYEGGYNPVSLGLMDDMIALCEKLLSGEIEGSADTGLPPEVAARFENARRATYGAAGMLYLPGQLQ